MASGKISKNSRTSKNTVMVRPTKEKPKKPTILIEITGKVAEVLKDNKDLSVYEGKQILRTIRRFGKDYLECVNN